jgi:hypothetical protein
MANTQRAASDHEPSLAGAAPDFEPSLADSKAWADAAVARKYHVHDGIPYSYGSGMIFPLPAPAGFAAFHPGVRPLVFQAVAQFVTNRIGQTQDGNVSAKIAACLATGEGMPGAQTNDAFDAAYRDYIAELVEAKLGDYSKDENGAELKGEALKVAKLKRDGIIDASANSPANNEKYFRLAVEAAVARGKAKPTSGKAKRTSKATTAGLEL